MGIIFSLLKTRIALVILILIVFMILLYFLTPKIPQQIQEPSPTPTVNTLSGLFNTQIGTSESQVAQLPNQKSRDTQNNQTTYSYPTPAQTRDNIIVIENGQAVFERSVTVDPNYTHPNLSELLRSLGTPEKEFKGSYYYGEEYITYIYASKGIAVVGNPLTNEVYEVHQFKPMSVEEYESKWGLDLHEFAGHQEQDH